ncbi:hypothetical protein BpHYR1_029018 [Brachionus plicatilis]|uniref:Uncharacterized protein n=1 Tax=Brachionus plicatilis TaxID=10195 RepID=A0A3M7SWI9_BRAPC|nr:hypothetical protein BpHYR1_029018 [Brachionus plicatilis]
MLNFENSLIRLALLVEFWRILEDLRCTCEKIAYTCRLIKVILEKKNSVQGWSKFLFSIFDKLNPCIDFKKNLKLKIFNN